MTVVTVTLKSTVIFIPPSRPPRRDPQPPREIFSGGKEGMERKVARGEAGSEKREGGGAFKSSVEED